MINTGEVAGLIKAIGCKCEGGGVVDPTGIIDDTACSGDTNKVWSADKSSALLNQINSVTEQIPPSRNIFDDTEIKAAQSITYNNGVYSGTSSAFEGIGNMMSGKFDENKRYVFSVYAYTDADYGNDGDGLCLRFTQSDSSVKSVYFPNSASEYTRKYVVSESGKNVSSIRFASTIHGSNVWHVKMLQVEEGTEVTEYVVPSNGGVTAVDTIARAMADEVSELDNKVTTMETAVSKAENDIANVTNTEISRNIFKTDELSKKSGITYSNGVFTGTTSSFGGTYMENDFEEGKQYTIQLKAQKTGDPVQTNGLVIKLKHTDNTASVITIPNSTTSYTKFTATSVSGKSVASLFIEYVSGGSNVWNLKEIQIEQGTEATEYEEPGDTITAVDIVARSMAEENKHDPWYYRFGSDYLRIAYSSMHIDIPNSSTHWLVASDMGFNVLKGDVEITSDGKLIMCHDEGFTFDGNGRITTYDVSDNTPIVEMTYAECRAKEYALLPQRYGDYCPVADIDDFLQICKEKGKIAFVTIRSTNTADVVDALADKIHFYGMEHKTIINALTTSILEKVRENSKCNDIALNFIAGSNSAITTANVDSCVSLGKCFLSVWCNDTTSIIDSSATAIAYADEKDVPVLGACISSMTTWNYMISKGIRGSQIAEPIFDYEPKNQRFIIAISNGSASFGKVFGSDRYTGTVSLSGTTLTVSGICIKDSLLTNVIDGIQPIKMNLFNPVIRCFDSNGNTIPCVWSNNAFVITLSNTNDDNYTVIVDV